MARYRRACAVGWTDSRRPGRHLDLDRGGAGVVHRQGPLDVDRVQPAPDRTPARGAIRRWNGTREPRDGPGVDGGSGGSARGARWLRRLPRGTARRRVWPRCAGARAHDVGRCVRRRDGRGARASQGARIGPRQVPGRRRGRARERGGDRSSGSGPGGATFPGGSAQVLGYPRRFDPTRVRVAVHGPGRGRQRGSRACPAACARGARRSCRGVPTVVPCRRSSTGSNVASMSA